MEGILDIYKYLIIIGNEDKTEEIKKIEFDRNGYNCNVTYRNNKTYPYNKNRIEYFCNPKEINSSDKKIYVKKCVLNNVKKILSFDKYTRIFFNNGNNKVYLSSDIIITGLINEESKSSDIFDYLTQISNLITIQDTDDKDKNFLGKQYSEININNESALWDYLNPHQLYNLDDSIIPIFPFGFNLNQKKATKEALNNKISIIEGPPGTGKTQTILNIISNIVINKKTVAVVSNNNSATENVIEKLRKYDLSFFCAFLGKNENKEKFFDNQKIYNPVNENWKMDNDKSYSLYEQIKISDKKLNEIYKIRNEYAQLKQEYEKIRIEQKYYEEYCDKTNIDNIKINSMLKLNSDSMISIWVYYSYMMSRFNKFSFFNKTNNLLKYGIFNFKLYKNNPSDLILVFQKMYFDLKMKELKNKLEFHEKELERCDYIKEIENYSNLSMKYFKNSLAQIYNYTRKKYSKDIIKKNSKEFLKDYPVVLSTTHSLRNCIDDNYLFDYVIIDESSQVDVVTGALALSCAKRAIIVGDLKQLPNIIEDKKIIEYDSIFEKYKINEAYNYSKNSLMSSLKIIFSDISSTMLREHYRCHPKIIDFCNQKFYDNQLIILSNDNGIDEPLLAYRTVKGNHERYKSNQRQVDVIEEEILSKIKDLSKNRNIGIISPYRNQVSKLQSTIKNEFIQIDTVHKFQGMEKNIIILSTVANVIKGFVDNPNLVNVAISRAIDKFIVVVSNNEKNKDSNIGDLLDYIDYNSFKILDSEIYSIFDILYKEFSEKLLDMYNKMEKISEYNSENAMYYTIKNILERKEYNNLDVRFQYQLNQLIKNTSNLDDTENKYLSNPNTHIDFIIYNRIGKKLVLAIEVDGSEFHSKETVQYQRDIIKNGILDKYNIPYIRFSTDESRVEEKICRKLNELDIH
jgi:superfamily I DNA and/or RNA helicase